MTPGMDARIAQSSSHSDALQYLHSFALRQPPQNCIAAPQDQSKEDTDPDVAWDVEHIASDEDGLVIFDGGAYSRGPAAVFDDGDGSSSEHDEDLKADKERLERQLSLEVPSHLTLRRLPPWCP